MEKEKYQLKQLIRYLESVRGRHTELVTVYIPAGYNINIKINQLSEEAGTAGNIQSKTVRTNVVTAIERMITELRKYKQTPQNGLALFSGNVSEVEGKPDFRVWTIHPPEPIRNNLYRCDSTFIVEQLKELVEPKHTFGLVVVDLRDATVAFLKGNSIVPVKEIESAVMGKFKAGGQCLSNDTLVQKSDGGIVPISEINKLDLLGSVDFSKNIMDSSQCIDKWNVRKEGFVIKTKNPVTEITASHEHTFFIVTDRGIEKTSSEKLRVGDYLVIPTKINVLGEAQFLKQPKIEKVALAVEGRNIIIDTRKQKGISQKQLAKLVGLNINQANISAFERNVLNFKKDNLKKVCTVLGINIDEFFKRYVKTINIPKVLDKKLGQILGYFIGDGCAEEHRLCFFEQTKEVAMFYKELLENYFKINTALKFRKDKNYHEIKAYGKPVVELFRLNFGIEKGADKKIPSVILKSSDEILAAFLRGQFDAEGYVSKDIALGINNKVLASQIRLALLRFGIIASITEYDNRRNPYSDKPRFTVEISDKDSMKSFSEKIGFTSKSKQEKINSVLNKRSDTSYTRQVFLPGTKIIEIARNYGYNTRSFKTSSNFFRNERKISNNAFAKAILSQIKNKELHQKMSELMNSEISIARIKDIQRTGKKVDMVDISVRNENFIANNLVVHNSAGRFHRIRENQIVEFMKRTSALMDTVFRDKKVEGIVVGGPGPAKEDLVDNYLSSEIKKLVLGMVDIGYTGEQGLKELLAKSEDLFHQEEIYTEKKIVDKFLTHLAKDDGLSSYGEEEVMQNLKNGTVELLIMSESLPMDTVDKFSAEAEKFGTKVEMISVNFPEGIQLQELGGIAAILRYKV